MSDALSAWVSTPKSQHLKGRKSRDTTPEICLRKAVHARGLRFRLQRRLAPGCRPDFVLVRQRLAVFVDGCFWHSCPVHGRQTPFTGPNAALWEQKMARNRERDQRANALAVAAGFRVFRAWECAIRSDVEQVVLDLVIAAAAITEAGSLPSIEPLRRHLSGLNKGPTVPDCLHPDASN